MNAIAMLEQQHQKVKDLFELYEKALPDDVLDGVVRSAPTSTSLPASATRFSPLKQPAPPRASLRRA